MLATKATDPTETLDFARRAVRHYCYIYKLSLIPVRYGEVPEKAKAAFHYPPPTILLWGGISIWLGQYPPRERAWALLSCIGHELAHYKQYISIKRRKVPILLRELENEASLTGRQYADDTIAAYTPEEINPILPEIASAAITGVGLGIGFKAVDLITKRLGISKNPLLAKQFSGKVFYLWGVFRYREYAQDEALRLRRLGYKVRIYDVPEGWAIYYYPKIKGPNPVVRKLNPITINGWKFPFTDIGQISPEVKKELLRLVRQGIVIKYADYTFPLTKTGYALSTHKESLQKQTAKETLRSFRQGLWKYHPQRREIEKQLLAETK